MLWKPEAEKEGIHGRHSETASSHALTVLSLAHRDGGGQLTLAVLNCRKITIAAVNGHAVRRDATLHPYSFDVNPCR